MQHTDSLWRVFSVVYFSHRNSPVCVMAMWESETTKASSDTVFKGQGQLMVLVCGRWFYHPHGCFFNGFVLCILPLRLRRRETCLFDHLALCPIFLPCSCLPILIVIFKNKDASSKIRKQYRRLRSNMCLSILFARRKYVVLLSRDIVTSPGIVSPHSEVTCTLCHQSSRKPTVFTPATLTS